MVGIIDREDAEKCMQSLVNTAEVQRVFSMPLRTFLQSSGHSSRDAIMPSGDSGHPDIPYRLHFFEIDTLPVCWGLTASVLIKLAKRAFGQEPEFCEAPPGARDYADISHNGSHLVYR